MKEDMILKKIKPLHNRLRVKLATIFAKVSSFKAKITPAELKLALAKPQLMAHRLIGEKSKHVLPLFKGLDQSLQKSNLKVSFKAYVSLIVLATFLISLVALVFIPCLLFFAFNVSPLAAVLFGIGGSLLLSVLSTAGFYAYPVYRADKLKRELEDELLFTTSYMTILASAGVSTESIFCSLSNLGMSFAVSAEAKNIIRNVDLFGSDIISALEEASKRTPSGAFREMLEGFISTIHSGGDLAAYLREKSRQYMGLKRISLRKFSDTLSVLSEFYIALLLTGPLLLVIMLSIMAMLSGGSLGLLSPDLLLNLLTYLGLPIGAAAFLIILSAVTPKW